MRHLPERWGRFEGISGLPLIIVASNALVYLFQSFSPDLALFLGLSHDALRAGELWRAVTFLFVPPSAVHPVFMILWLYVTYLFASALEQAWGTFRFTLYYFTGVLATLAVALLPSTEPVTNAFLNTSLFLAFASLFPHVQVLLFFIIPIKVRYLGWFTWLGLGLAFWGGTTVTRWTIAASLVNFLLLLGPDIWRAWRFRWEVRRNRQRWEKH